MKEIREALENAKTAVAIGLASDGVWIIDEALSLLDKMDWQPIETAPKERGLRVLVWSNWFKTPTIAMYQDFGNYQCWEGENGNRKLEPTHWKPLPEKP